MQVILFRSSYLQIKFILIYTNSLCGILISFKSVFVVLRLQEHNICII
jgi:hypothetical protein